MSEEHWDRVYATKGRDDVSWYQAVPATSVRLVTAAIPATAAPRRVIDIGAGASTLADELLTRGYDVTVVCLSYGERGESAKRWKQEGMTHDRVKTERRREAAKE